MGCGSSSQAEHPESTGHRAATDNTTDTNTNNTNTKATTYNGMYPDDNAIYGKDDDKKTDGAAGGKGSNANEMQYDDKGYYGETDREKRDVDLFDDSERKEENLQPEGEPEPPVECAEEVTQPEPKPEPEPEPEPEPAEPEPKPEPEAETELEPEIKHAQLEHVPKPSEPDLQTADGDIKETADYTPTDTGLLVQFNDFRICKDDDEGEKCPTMAAGDVYEDRQFQLYDAITDSETNTKLEWKRPNMITEKTPVLFSEGTTRYDIGQGGAGTCWFLSTIANISEDPALLKQVIPQEDYPADGVFHARFWRFGKWEDVYIDDCLPIIYNTRPWGAHSATDDSEFWVSLLEKAFARYHGSYNNIYGGQPGDAYLALTGGVAERIDFEENDDKPKKLFKRIRNAVNSGAHLTCVVPDEHDKMFGLVGGHAYSLTGTAQTNGVCLVRVRNPWGNTEWTGDWSDESPLWEGVPESDVKRAVIDDGEFWISLQDFMTYFSQTTICSLTPDFDMDGSSDCLNYVTNMYGEWRGDTAAGYKNRLKNPCFLFVVPESVSKAQVVVQLIQKVSARQNEKFQIRCDLYKVLQNTRDAAVMDLMGNNTNTYYPETQCSFRFSLGPGTYAVVPSTMNPDLEKQFLIRVFSSCALNRIQELPRTHKLMSSKEAISIVYEEQTYPLNHCEAVAGSWVVRKGFDNAGGQIQHSDTHANNPQFVISVSEPTAVMLHVAQEQDGKQLAVGFRLYPTGDAPLSYKGIHNLYEDAVPDISGKQYQFVQSYDVDSSYMLGPGHFTLLVHTDDAGDEKRFCLIVRSSAKVLVEGFQTGLESE